MRSAPRCNICLRRHILYTNPGICCVCLSSLNAGMKGDILTWNLWGIFKNLPGFSIHYIMQLKGGFTKTIYSVRFTYFPTIYHIQQDILLAPQVLLEKVQSESHPTIDPLIAFEHLRLYIQKHLGQSVAVCGSLHLLPLHPLPLHSLPLHPLHLHPLPLHPFHKIDQAIHGATCICDAIFEISLRSVSFLIL